MPDGSSRIDASGLSGAALIALEGLSAPQKWLPAKLFYDDAGCALFQRITELPEYYVTRTELALLEQAGPEIGAAAPAGAMVVEYGAGSETKAAALLRVLREPRAYLGIDVAAEALRAGADRLQNLFPGVEVRTFAADFTTPFRLPPVALDARRLGFFPGSTIGNMDPGQARQFLRNARLTLGRSAYFLIGADLRKDPAILLPAYDDAQGVTAAFNRNVLVRLNREAGANFDPQAFAHRALWNEDESRIEMHLVSGRRQTVRVAGRPFVFAAGESIHTENSYKLRPGGFRAMAASAGWLPVEMWTDPGELFSIHLLQAEP